MSHTSSNPFDHVPNEILNEIIYYTLFDENKTPLQFSLHPRPGAFPVKSTPPESQTAHRQDWILINSTCQRFRNVGKRVFFQTRPLLVMRDELQWLKHQHWAKAYQRFPFFTPQDRQLCLEQTRHIVCLARQHDSDMINLDNIINAFTKKPQQKKCTVVCDLPYNDVPTRWVSYRKDGSSDKPALARIRKKNVGEYAKRLAELHGLDPELNLELGLSDREEWIRTRRYFKSKLFPQLEEERLQVQFEILEVAQKLLNDKKGEKGGKKRDAKKLA